MELLFGWRGRVRRWPRFDRDRSPWGMDGGPGDIKVVSTDVLKQLMDTAIRTPLASATGRPAWLQRNRGELSEHYLVAHGPAVKGLYRCIVTSVLGDSPGGIYTLDVKLRDFHALADIAPTRLVEFAHRYLDSFPRVPLDPSQEASWDRLRVQRRSSRRPATD